ncbi:MAG: hypothetical protein ABEI52_05585 [Halobacteriaceae archaeon]
MAVEAGHLTQLLSEELSQELASDIAETVVEQLDDQFDELGLKSESLETVLADFQTRKMQDVAVERQYRRKIGYIETYLTEVRDRQATDDLTDKDIEGYERWRKRESLDRDAPLAASTLQDDMYLFREFVRYLIEHRMAPARFEHHVRIPRSSSAQSEGVDTKKLDADRASDILNFLRKFHWADVEHVVFELMCEAGPRKSGLYALDVEDFKQDDEAVLHFKHRDNTPLKNDEKSERSITLYGDVSDVIQDYLKFKRDEADDEFGRNPLLTTGDGRIGKSTIKKISYMWTRPCQIGNECPHQRDPETCGAANQNGKAFKCPSSRAPHHVRTGYITAKRNEGVPIEAISQRCDVSPRVLEKHYDLPNTTQERKRHDSAFRNSGHETESGFSHQED